MENTLTSRREALIKLMVPELKRRAQQEAIKKSLAASFSEEALTEGLLQPLLLSIPATTTTTASSSPSTKTTSTTSTLTSKPPSLLEYFQGLEDLVSVWLKGSADGDVYFFPPETGSYYFATDKGGGKLFVGHQPVDFSSGKRRVSQTAQALSQGQATILSFTDGLTIKDLTYSTASGDVDFSSRTVCPIQLAADACTQLKCLGRSLVVAKQVGLASVDEISFQQSRGSVLYQLDMASLGRLRTFARVRKAFRVPGSVLVTYS